MNLTVKTYFKVFLNLCVCAVTVLLCIFLLPKLILFFMPFIIAWIIAWLASPVVRFFEEKLRFKRKIGSVVVIVVVLAIVVLVLYLALDFAAAQIAGFVEYAPALWAEIAKELQELLQKFSGLIAKLPINYRLDVDQILLQLGENMAGRLSSPDSGTVDAIGNVAKQIPNVIVGVVVTLLASYFFVADKAAIVDFYEKHCPKMIKYRLDIISKSFKKAVGGYFKAQLKIEVWIYIMMVVGFCILGIPYGWLIAIGIAFLDFLPIFGTGTVMIPWAILKLVDGDYKMVIGLLITWGLGQLLRQIIQPKIVGDSMGLPALPTLFLIYLGYKFGGVGGMIIALPVGIIFVSLYEEGMFDTTVKSFKILFAGLNHFRKLKDEDLLILHEYKKDINQEIKEKGNKKANEKSPSGDGEK